MIIAANDKTFGDHTDNTMKPRAVGALYLHPTGSLTGGSLVHDMNTGRMIHQKSATPTPLTKKEIIQRQTKIAEAQKMPPSRIMFGDKEGNTTILVDLEDAVRTRDNNLSDGIYWPEDEAVDTALSGYIDNEDTQLVVKAPVKEVNTDAANENNHNGDNAPKGYKAGPEDLVVITDVNEGQEPAKGNTITEEPYDTSEAAVEPFWSRLHPGVTRAHNKCYEAKGFHPTSHMQLFFTAGYTRAANHLSHEHHALSMVTNAIEN